MKENRDHLRLLKKDLPDFQKNVVPDINPLLLSLNLTCNENIACSHGRQQGSLLEILGLCSTLQKAFGSCRI